MILFYVLGYIAIAEMFYGFLKNFESWDFLEKVFWAYAWPACLFLLTVILFCEFVLFPTIKLPRKLGYKLYKKFDK